MNLVAVPLNVALPPPEPDEEDKALLEQNIQMALQQQTITLSDAIDIRDVHNLTLANQLLKLRQKQKAEEDQKRQQQMMEAQAQANAKAAEQAAMAEVQKKQALAQTELQIEQGKSQFDLQKIQTEGEIKKQLKPLKEEA